MKKYKLITLLFVCFSFISKAQLQDIYTNNTQFINSMSFKNNKLLIGGIYGYIGQLNNTLDSIIDLNTPIFNAYTQIQQTDSNIIYVYSDQGNITLVYKSLDGGQTWQEKLNTDSIIDRTLTMLTKDEGILFCFASTSLHTYDGGDTWIRKGTGIYSPMSPTSYYDSSICLGTSIGVAVSNDQWQTKTTIQINAPAPFFHQQIKYLDKNTIVDISQIANDSPIFIFSTNSGNTWTKKSFYPIYFDPAALDFKTISEGFVVGATNITTPSAVIYKTTDTGTNWTSYDTYLPLIFTRINLINDSIAIIGTSTGKVYKWNIYTNPTSTTNFTTTSYFNIYPNPTQNTIHIIPKTNTKIISCKLYNSIGTLIKTTQIQNNSIDINELPKGNYFLLLQTEKGTQTTKVIKN